MAFAGMFFGENVDSPDSTEHIFSVSSQAGSENSLDRGLRSTRAFHSISIVDWEARSGGGWILSHFAKRLGEELRGMGFEASIDLLPNRDADVVHHIPFHPAKRGLIHQTVTTMVTHLDTRRKSQIVRRQLGASISPICLSSATANEVREYCSKSQPVFYLVPPAARPERMKTTKLGIFTRTYKDGRKKSGHLAAIAETIDPTEYEFKIMGSGWTEQVKRLLLKGFRVDYSPVFDLERYRSWIVEVDFCLYFGLDEGAISVLDALQAGTSCIAPDTGYHLDLASPLLHFARTPTDFVYQLEKQTEEKRRTHLELSSNSWKDYAANHLRIWDWIRSNRRSES